jgi:hypothetical protein
LVDEIVIIYSADTTTYEEADITRIKDIIENLGMKTLIAQIDEHLNKLFERKRFKLILNLVPALDDRFSRFLPAMCELLKIPYVGAGVFTNSMLTGNFSKEILNYHGIGYSDKPSVSTHYIAVVGNNEKIVSNVVRLDKEGKFFKDLNLDKEAEKNLIANAMGVKSSLKILDLLSLSGSFSPKQKGKFMIKNIDPAPSLKESSIFCEVLKVLGISYEEIVASILISAMQRYKIALSESLEVISHKIFG